MTKQKSIFESLVADIEATIHHLTDQMKKIEGPKASKSRRSSRGSRNKKTGGMANLETVPGEVFQMDGLIGSTPKPETIVNGREVQFLSQVARPAFADNIVSMGGIENISSATRDVLLPQMGGRKKGKRETKGVGYRR